MNSLDKLFPASIVKVKFLRKIESILVNALT